VSEAPVEPATCGNCGAAGRAEPWCPHCLERYERPDTTEPDPLFEYVRARAPRMYSRTRGGPTSFGAFGRIVMSVVPVVVGFFAIRNIVRSRSDGTIGYYIVLGVPAVVMAVAFLAVVWRRERTS
jgi:hypothetical protein